MRLPFVTATLFITGTLLSLNPSTSVLDQPLQNVGLGKPEFSLGELSLENGGEVLAETTTEKEAPATPETPETTEQPAQPVETYVTVTAGDTLDKIAKAHSTTYKRIFDANTNIANPDVVSVGMQLRIPRSDEVLASREIPVKQVKQATPKLTAASKTSQPIASSAPTVASGSVWDRLAACESGGNWQINTGNGYYGGLQFLPSTWRAVGGTGLPHQHSREEQIKRAEILLARSGWGQWPACTAKLGLR